MRPEAASELIEMHPDFDAWRARARFHLSAGHAPADVEWGNCESQSSLFRASDAWKEEMQEEVTSFRVPHGFMEQARVVAAHREPDTEALLYRVLWRLTHEDRNLLQISVDPDTIEFQRRFRAVMRDCHKMKAFVRFRERGGHYVAWHEPDHRIVPLVAPFFARRFGAMNWSILTPVASAHWDRERLRLDAGCPRSHAPIEDGAEELWKTYYASIFNPARLKLKAMTKELPVRHWKTLPEAELIPSLIRGAGGRLQAFADAQSRWPGADPFLPETSTLSKLRISSERCRGCGLCELGSRVVFGEGKEDSRVVFVGEQPGDQEDREGRPFVGPAGQLWERALREAGIDRDSTYVTNAVKHFKFKPQGSFRLHQKPGASEIAACRPWLRAELELIRPELLICLGVTAAQSVFGRAMTLREVEGKVLRSPACERTVVLPHPSGILRIPDPAARVEAFGKFASQLRWLKESCWPAA